MILIVNDDGYTDNLLVLTSYCKNIDEEVKFIVPSENQSNVGNKFSLKKTFNVFKKTDGFIIDGTPVDCVKLGVYKFNPDLLITGVNKGFNIGKETLLNSGTFMSAREGYLNGIKSLSCSYDAFKKLDASLLKKVLDKSLRVDFKLANLNIVSESVMITTLCDNMFSYEIKENSVKVSIKKEFLKGTDGDTVFNQNTSSLTILE